MSWYDPTSWSWDDAKNVAGSAAMGPAGWWGANQLYDKLKGDSPQLGSQGSPSNYNAGPDKNGFGGPGQIFGGGQVPLGGLNLPYFQQDRDRLSGMLDGKSPFAGSEWGTLISQLQARASGTGPSIAGDAYKQASQDSINNLTSLSQNSASPGAARQALLQQGHVQQGMAQGYSAARNQEMLGAGGQLAGALGARDQINQSAFTNILGQQLGLSEGQLNAGMANQRYALGNAQVSEQEKAAKLQALSSLLAGLAKIGGG